MLVSFIVWVIAIVIFLFSLTVYMYYYHFFNVAVATITTVAGKFHCLGDCNFSFFAYSLLLSFF